MATGPGRILTISPLLLIIIFSLVIHTCNARLRLAASHAERVSHHSSKGVKRGSVRLHSKTLVEFLKNGEVGSKAKTGKSLGVVPKGSFVVVSRRSLHGKHEPGFHLDYSPPLTHPPVHN